MFFRNVLATVVGMFLFFGLMFLFFIAMISLASSGGEVVVENNSILRLELNRTVVERSSRDPLQDLGFFAGMREPDIGLIELKKAIQNAADDDKIKGILLEPRFIDAGFATLEEIRNDLLTFKETGKFIIAYGEVFSEKDYYLASIADEIYITPEGAMEFNGLQYKLTFLKGTFEKLGVEPQVFRVGEFKSAIEPFVRSDMSKENKMQSLDFITSIYDHYLDKVATARDIEIEELRRISDSMLVRNVNDALDLDLITKKGYFDQVLQNIQGRLEIDDDEKIPFTTWNEYHQFLESETGVITDNKIAVIIGQGEINFGEGDDGVIGSEKFSREIRKARKNDKIKAIVLRLNSPGGLAVASDVIWRELELAKQAKPVIASMSDVAASGGYYLAMACDTIVAQPNTVTGSIGIFALVFNLNKFFNEKLGITFDEVTTGQFSGIFTLTRPLNETEKEIIQNQIEEGYQAFLEKAADGREMALERLKEVAEGRVWTGDQSLNNGLIDVLGGLDNAIEIAAGVAGLGEDYRVDYYPKRRPLYEELLVNLSGSVEAKVLEQHYGEFFRYISVIRNLENYRGLLTRLPFDIEIN